MKKPTIPKDWTKTNFSRLELIKKGVRAPQLMTKDEWAELDALNIRADEVAESAGGKFVPPPH